VTVTYTPTGGGAPVVFSHNTPIPAGASATFYSVSSLASPAGIVAIANESSTAPNPSGQDTKNYEGFNQ
jgi:hypothetical protein